MKSLAPAIVTIALALAGPARGQDCPHERATTVPSRWAPQGATRKCGKPISVLNGSGGTSAFQPTCPEFVLITPGHGECQGEYAQDRMCVKTKDLPVSLMTCECDRTVFGNGWVSTGCSCWFDSVAGSVEHFDTHPCVILRD